MAAQIDEKRSSPEADANRRADPSSAETSSDNPATTVDGNPLKHVSSQSEGMGKKQIALIIGALCLVLFLVALDMTVIATALPTIANRFKASESGYTWMASAYLLATAACIPLWGKLSDIWGRKPILLLVNILFLAGSLVCALAINLTMLLAGRAVQGVGGGGVIVLGQICVSDLFSVRERPVYFGLFGAVWAIAGALGPIIGGALTQKASWRWCFYLNLPVGGISFAILLFWLKIHTPKTPLTAGLRAIDWVGTATIVGGTIMFLFGLEFGGVSHPWNSPTVICLIIFGAAVLGLFAFNEWKFAKYPIIPMTLFVDWSNVIALGCCWAHATVFIAGAYYVPLYFQTVLLVSPIMSGVYILPQIFSLSVLAGLVGFLIRKTGRYVEIIQLGMVFMTLGYGLFIDFKPYTSWPRLIIYQILAGIGAGPNFQAPLIALQSGLKPSDVAAATSTFGFIRQLSTATSIVLGGVVYQNVLKHQASKIISALGPDVGPTFISSFSAANLQRLRTLHPSQQHVVLEAYTYAFSRAWIFYTCIAGVGTIMSLFLRRKELSRQHELTKTGLEEQEKARQERLAEKREKKMQKEKESKQGGRENTVNKEVDKELV